MWCIWYAKKKPIVAGVPSLLSLPSSHACFASGGKKISTPEICFPIPRMGLSPRLLASVGDSGGWAPQITPFCCGVWFIISHGRGRSSLGHLPNTTLNNQSFVSSCINSPPVKKSKKWNLISWSMMAPSDAFKVGERKAIDQIIAKLRKKLANASCAARHSTRTISSHQFSHNRFYYEVSLFRHTLSVHFFLQTFASGFKIACLHIHVLLHVFVHAQTYIFACACSRVAVWK